MTRLLSCQQLRAGSDFSLFCRASYKERAIRCLWIDMMGARPPKKQLQVQLNGVKRSDQLIIVGSLAFGAL